MEECRRHAAEVAKSAISLIGIPEDMTVEQSVTAKQKADNAMTQEVRFRRNDAEQYTTAKSPSDSNFVRRQELITPATQMRQI